MRRVDYVIHYVESLTRSVTFYHDVIGLQVRIEGDGYVEFATANTKFSLFERSKLPELIGRRRLRRAARSVSWLTTWTARRNGCGTSVSRSSPDRWTGPGVKGRSTSPTRTATSSNSPRSCGDRRRHRG